MKNKFTHIVLMAFLASLLSYTIAQACSPISPRILVKCSNLEASIEGGSPPVAGDTYESALKKRVDATINNLLAVAPECEEDLTPVLPTFEEEIKKWLDYRNKRSAFLDGDLILEPYSAARDSELINRTNNLLSCDDEEYKHIGNWIIIFETSRPYCHLVPGTCGSIILSLGHFLFYLVANISLTTLPYLAGLLFAGAAIIYAWWRILKNNSALKLWKILVLSSAVLVAELFLMIMPIWLPGQLIGWVLFFGLLVLWQKQFTNQKSVSGPKAGYR